MECGGCSHGHWGDIRASTSPIWFPFMALYFVFMIAPQSVMPAQVTPALVHPGCLERESHSG